jgi:mono/diheme cytochrome c family protein
MMILLLIWSGCASPSPEHPEPTESGAGERDRGVAWPQVHGELTLPPVQTFADACARCHGPEGSFYGEAFASLDGQELEEIIHEMMVGPAYLSPSAADVAAMTAYHRALAADEPFVAIVDPPAPNVLRQKDLSEQIRIDASPGARIQIDRSDDAVVIAAHRGDKATRIEYPPQQWSHGSGSRVSDDSDHAD